MIEVSKNYTVGLPIAASTYAGQVDSCIKIVHYGMGVIFVLWGIFFVYCLARFRRRAGVRAVYPTGHGLGAFVPDLAVLVFEIWMIFFLGLPVWSTVKNDFPPADKANVVELVAEQFAWGFHYPGTDGKFGSRDAKYIDSANLIGIDYSSPNGQDDFLSENELHVPLGKPTILYMTSKDVIHSFFVPEFRVKQDVVPGMRIPLWFEPTQVGHFEIGCAQLCGLGHYRMRGEVVVDTPEAYDAWIKAQVADAHPPAAKPS
jgi:cytochrome c oxidase subunit 2